MFMFLFFKQKTAYEMRVSDWSSDVCSSDLNLRPRSRGSSSADRSSGISRKLSCPYAIERHYASSIHEYSTQCDATCNARPAPDHSAPDSHPDADARGAGHPTSQHRKPSRSVRVPVASLPPAAPPPHSAPRVEAIPPADQTAASRTTGHPGTAIT